MAITQLNLVLCILVKQIGISPSPSLQKLIPKWTAKDFAHGIQSLKLELQTALKTSSLFRSFKSYERGLTEEMPEFQGWSHYEPNPALKNLAWSPLFPETPSPYTVHIAARI